MTAAACQSTFLQQVEHLSLGGAIFLSVLVIAVAVVMVAFVRFFD